MAEIRESVVAIAARTWPWSTRATFLAGAVLSVVIGVLLDRYVLL